MSGVHVVTSTSLPMILKEMVYEERYHKPVIKVINIQIINILTAVAKPSTVCLHHKAIGMANCKPLIFNFLKQHVRWMIFRFFWHLSQLATNRNRLFWKRATNILFYFYHLQTNHLIATRRWTLIKQHDNRIYALWTSIVCRNKALKWYNPGNTNPTFDLE